MVEDAEEFVQRRGRRLQRVVELGQLLHRVEQVRHEQHERDDRSERHRVAMHEPAAETHEQCGRDDPGELDETEVARRDPHAVKMGAQQRGVPRGETGSLAILGPARLHDAHRGDPFLDLGQGRANLFSHVEIGPVRRTLEPHRCDDDHREHHQGDQRQLPGQHHEYTEREYEQ